ncbi:TPA: J domain-containing protein [Streptococcus suis]
MNPVLDFFLTALLVGVLGSVFLVVAWKVLRIAVVAFIVGNIVMYGLALWVIFSDLPEYWRLLTTGDQEAFWITAYLVALSLGGLGFLVWNIFGLSIDMPQFFQKKQYEEPTQTQNSQQEEGQEQAQQERTYFQESNTTYLRDLELLGLERGCSQDDIKTAYRKLSKKYHPDVNPDPHATIIFKQIQKAYQNLAQ